MWNGYTVQDNNFLLFYLSFFLDRTADYFTSCHCKYVNVFYRHCFVLCLVLYIQWPPFGLIMCLYICQRTLSVQRCKQFSESEAWGTDNVQGQVYEHIFTPNGAYHGYYPSNICATGRKMFINNFLFAPWNVYFSVFSGMTLWSNTYVSFVAIAKRSKCSWIKFETSAFIVLSRRKGLKIREYHLQYVLRDFLVLADTFNHVMHLDQSHTKEKYLMDCNWRYTPFLHPFSISIPLILFPLISIPLPLFPSFSPPLPAHSNFLPSLCPPYISFSLNIPWKFSQFHALFLLYHVKLARTVFYFKMTWLTLADFRS